MTGFRKTNQHLNETMKTHLIDDLDEYGVWTNNYEAFLKARGQKVLDEISRRLNPDIS